MKKLALAIGFAAYVVFGSQSASLAAHRSESTSALVTVRDARIATYEGGTTTLWHSASPFFAEENLIAR
jgi:hypothetical protein